MEIEPQRPEEGQAGAAVGLPVDQTPFKQTLELGVVLMLEPTQHHHFIIRPGHTVEMPAQPFVGGPLLVPVGVVGALAVAGTVQQQLQGVVLAGANNLAVAGQTVEGQDQPAGIGDVGGIAQPGQGAAVGTAVEIAEGIQVQPAGFQQRLGLDQRFIAGGLQLLVAFAEQGRQGRPGAGVRTEFQRARHRQWNGQQGTQNRGGIDEEEEEDNQK